jgi:hypothetical protein
MSLTKKTFKNTGDTFSGVRAAEDYIRQLGYSLGSMERHRPIGLLKGEGHYISKWTRMTDAEHNQLDGWLEGPDYREGDVTVVLRASPATTPALTATLDE